MLRKWFGLFRLLPFSFRAIPAMETFVVRDRRVTCKKNGLHNLITVWTKIANLQNPLSLTQRTFIKPVNNLN